jgi:CO/xanthine dehydrogenase FAD-binding subunit
VKPAPFDYVAARSLEEALAALAEAGEDAKPLAGGQSLVPALNMRLVRPTVLVDLNRAGLDEVTVEDGRVRVGATVRQAALGRSPHVHPLARAALPYVGHVVTRNRGTVGGSIAHADGAAELPLCLVAAGGSVLTDRREIPAADFFVTHFHTVLEPGELVTATVWPRPGAGERFAFAELALRAGDFALAMCAVRLAPEGATVAVAAVTDRPVVLEDVGALVGGQDVGPELAAEAGALAAGLVDPPGSNHATPAYLPHLPGVLAPRAPRERA